jgi:hypothetical protein
VSAFDIIFDKSLTVTQNGVERELSVEEALQLKTYQDALKGSKMAIRAVLNMIERREVALAKKAPVPIRRPMGFRWEQDPRNVDEAMLLLGITLPDPSWSGPCQYGTRMKLATWAAQAALSRREDGPSSRSRSTRSSVSLWMPSSSSGREDVSDER